MLTMVSLSAKLTDDFPSPTLFEKIYSPIVKNIFTKGTYYLGDQVKN